MRHWQLLIESDAQTRELERKWKASGDEQDRRRYLRALQREGKTEEAVAVEMHPYVETYRETRRSLLKASRGYRGRSAQEARLAQEAYARAVDDHRAATRELQQQATRLQTAPGIHIPREEGEGHGMHIHRLAHISGLSDDISMRDSDAHRARGNKVRVAWPYDGKYPGVSAEDRTRHFADAMNHHYPELEAKPHTHRVAHTWADSAEHPAVLHKLPKT